MADLLTLDQALKLWRVPEALTKRRKYFDATHAVDELLRPRIDGRAKTQDKMNWVRYIVQRHVGFLTSRQVSYLPVGEDRSGVAALSALYRQQHLAENDAHLLTDAILYGYGIELLTMQGATKAPLLTATDALEWCPVRDEYNQLVAAVRCVSLPAGTRHECEMLKEARAVWTLYTDKEIIRFDQVKNAQGGLMIRELTRESHSWGAVPVIEYNAMRGRTSFISDALLRKCDNYDVSRSSLVDDIKHNVDALLVTEGVDYQALLEKDEHGRSVLEKLKAVGLFPLPKDAKANYLQRTVDIEKFRFDQKTTRAEIHLMGCVPDLDETIAGNEGTITSISGVALKLMFHLMIEQSAEFARNFERGLRRRIELLDGLKGFGQPEIGDVAIHMNHNLPFADTEMLQYLGNLAGLLSREDRLRLLPFVDDPRAAAERAAAESPKPVDRASSTTLEGSDA